VNEVKRCAVNIDGKTTTIEILDNSNGEAEKFIVNGGKEHLIADDEPYAFLNYFSSIGGLTIDDINEGVKPKGTPVITFTYTLNDGSQDTTIGFVPKGKSNYYVLNNGKYIGAVVSKDKFEREQGGIIVLGKKLADLYGAK
jgi:hypothetical protein